LCPFNKIRLFERIKRAGNRGIQEIVDAIKGNSFIGRASIGVSCNHAACCFENFGVSKLEKGDKESCKKEHDQKVLGGDCALGLDYTTTQQFSEVAFDF
jgi:peptidyl-tRNA hydrolase